VAVLKELHDGDRVALRYCAAVGDVSWESNPNGSVESIAGIYGGPSKNVFGLMPHPERMSEMLVGGTDGKQLFESVLSP
jgi:phosphoribosylformylglycinamidine synthase